MERLHEVSTMWEEPVVKVHKSNEVTELML